MGIAEILGIILQIVQAGFQLDALVAKVQDMKAKGATDDQIHVYLKNLAAAAQADLEKA
jgi:hypothetical protein